MALDLSNKALTMMLKTVIGSLGIDGQALLDNLIQFQQFVLSQVKHHDTRLQNIEVAILDQNALLRQILENQNVGRNEHADTGTNRSSGGVALIEHASERHDGGTVEVDA